MVTIQPTKFSKFELFSNVANRIFYKIISRFPENDLLIAVTDFYNVELSIRSAERLRRTANLIQEIEIISNRKM